ncbi:uncharacterized protein BO87DRAFT_462139 [Aspergillus neoniger CBS 115656]|uniref:Uncharacterized protein n=1 Tax=Aspergillus neoniger (strain CBS 115656) TaxID=1448310 RepID=A0A318YD59_ASPNB|nr:hypothetical protein BO87DRAFT_462139 [Aspergillus neoniger CBS 115656]PYH30610.1 hypothetical protein BO87DRAFT_462139 [Aspergillus neoniger CBS 115656]
MAGITSWRLLLISPVRYSERNRQGAELQHRKLNCPPAASRWLNRDHLDIDKVIVNRGIVRIFRRLSYLPATPVRLPADALVLPADTIAGRRFEHPFQLILAEWLNRDHLDIEMVVFTRRIGRIKLPPASPLHFLPRLYPFQRPHAQDESSSLQVRAYCIIPGTTTTTAIAASLVTRYHQTLCATSSRSRKMNDQNLYLEQQPCICLFPLAETSPASSGG